MRPAQVIITLLIMVSNTLYVVLIKVTVIATVVHLVMHAGIVLLAIEVTAILVILVSCMVTNYMVASNTES